MDNKLSQAINPLSISLQQQGPKFRKRFKFKILLLGETNVGKSSILFQYTHNQDPSYQSPTVGIDFSRKVVYFNDIEIHLQIWDSAGRQQNQVWPRNIFNGVVGVLLVYDVSNRASFLKMEQYWNYLIQRGDQNKVVMLVGNCKLEEGDDKQFQRQVLNADGLVFAGPRRIQFKQISAKKHHLVHDVFQDLVKAILIKVQDGLINEEQVSLQVGINGRKINLNQKDMLSERRYNRCC